MPTHSFLVIQIMPEYLQETTKNGRVMSYVKNIRMFVRVFELGSMSAAARDQRTSPAVASARVSDLERHLGVRLFNRTTRRLQPTENGRLFYDGARRVLEAIDDAEAAVMVSTKNLKGTVFVAAPLGVGRRFIAPHVPAFKDEYPQIDVRLRLSDRRIDVIGEGLDMAFHLGTLEDSTLKMRLVAECPRVLCAAPAYVARRGDPETGEGLVKGGHDCLSLRFPGAPEFQWTLLTPEGPRRFEVAGPYETDDGDVLTGWALDGRGIVMKPIFEVADHLRSGALVPVVRDTPPVPVQLTCLTQHRRLRDPKITVFTDYVIARCRADLQRVTEGLTF